MGYCITGKDESKDQVFNVWSWKSLLTLALHFGWEPKGTVMTDWKDNKTGEITPLLCYDENKYRDGTWVIDDNWNGTYFGNDWQEIAADDAKNLADALGRALEYMSGGETGEIGISEELDKDSQADIENIINGWSRLDAQEKIQHCINLFKSGYCRIA